METIASSGFGDTAFVPGMSLKNPKGIRNIEECYIFNSIFSKIKLIFKITYIFKNRINLKNKIYI